MKPIYFDNAATSYPVSAEVTKAVELFLRGPFGNPGRSGHDPAINTSEAIYNIRKDLCLFFGVNSPENAAFTYNATSALNEAILGSASAIAAVKGWGFNVITSVWEHNSILRPLYALKDGYNIDIKFISAPFSNRDAVISQLMSLADKQTGMICLSACTNTTGETSPYCEIGEIAKRLDIPFILDGSQAAGHFPFSLPDSGADILCVPGHKGLLGIMGCGAMILSDTSRIMPDSTMFGGSGVNPQLHTMPQEPPERFEAGTPGVPAIIALGKGIELINRTGTDSIRKHEADLTHFIYDQLSEMKSIRLYSPDCGGSIILFNTKMSCEIACDMLNSRGICVRGGMHCAPKAHTAIKTSSNGAVRISVGISNTIKEAQYLVNEIRNLFE
ncbi:MAG: aminotransferase class V-fold PLP-dependent enzyme [Oscillospiraceae bacterium]|nr:aminotransferase class V-fold PLP-dependent enzyme [Oscillospiraceae bacterium]